MAAKRELAKPALALPPVRFDGAVPPPRAGAAHATITRYGPFTAGDGKTMMLGLQHEREVLCRAVLERPDVASDPHASS